MLKKLLASALAVATVASCAYVPTALASAATTYKTADVVTYQDWKLKNPDAPAAAKDKLTIYVSNGTTSTTYTNKEVEPENNNEEYIKANLNKVIDPTGATTVVSAADSKAAVKTEVAYVGNAGTNVYFVQLATKKAVLFRTYKAATAKATIDTAATTWEKDVQVLGYYDCSAAGVMTDAGKAAAFQEANKYTSEAKIGGATAAQEFAGWQYTAGGTANADVIAPVFVPRAAAFASNDETVNVKVVGTATAYELETGLYTAASTTPVVVPANADAATKALMIKNYLKATTGWYDVTPSVTSGSTTTTYSAYDLRLVDASTKTYGITFRANAPAAAGNVDVVYTVNFYDSTDSSLVASMTGKHYSATRYYTKDVEEIYTMLKASTDARKSMTSSVGGVLASDFNKATLAEYLAQNKANTSSTANPTAYVLTSGRTLQNVNEGAYGQYSVTIHAFVDKVTKYDVYSYAADNAVVKSTAWLTNKQIKADASTLQIAATAADLGVATSASIDNVPAEYAYAKVAVAPITTAPGVIYTTYKLGDAVGIELKDFQTAEGEFKSEPYFGRDAKVGDQVTLKVSLSETGVAKKLDLSKLDVKYAVSGNATVAKENYDYAATEFPAGEAIDITLGEGTNIVVATVYYNGTKVGTFEPFYAYVG